MRVNGCCCFVANHAEQEKKCKSNKNCKSKQPQTKPKQKVTPRQFVPETAPADEMHWEPSKRDLIFKIHEVLLSLSRDVRAQVIGAYFSEEQRRLLERWMVEKASRSSSTRSTPKTKPMESQDSQDSQDSKHREAMPTVLKLQFDNEKLQEVQATEKHPQFSIEDTKISFDGPRQAILERSSGKRPGARKRKKSAISGLISWTGKTGTSYRAYVVFSCLFIESKQCDMPTALDILVLLTATKQRISQSQLEKKTFGECVQDALDANAEEYGLSLADMGLRFRLLLRHRFFLGTKQMITPKFKSMLELGREYDKLNQINMVNRTRQNVLFTTGPMELEHQWKDFLLAWGDVCASVGWDRSDAMTNLLQIYNSNKEYRLESLRRWELLQMSAEDKNQKRRRGRNARDQRERRKMRLEDRQSYRLSCVAQAKSSNRCLVGLKSFCFLLLLISCVIDEVGCGLWYVLVVQERRRMTKEDVRQRRVNIQEKHAATKQERAVALLKRLLLQWQKFLLKRSEKVNGRPVKSSLCVYSKPKAIHAIIGIHQLCSRGILESKPPHSLQRIRLISWMLCTKFCTLWGPPIQLPVNLASGTMLSGTGDLVDEKSPAFPMQ